MLKIRRMRVNVKLLTRNPSLKHAIQTVYNKQIDDYISCDMIKTKICTDQSCKE
jgi:hypothetical protein